MFQSKSMATRTTPAWPSHTAVANSKTATVARRPLQRTRPRPAPVNHPQLELSF